MPASAAFCQLFPTYTTKATNIYVVKSKYKNAQKFKVGSPSASSYMLKLTSNMNESTIFDAQENVVMFWNTPSKHPVKKFISIEHGLTSKVNCQKRTMAPTNICVPKWKSLAKSPSDRLVQYRLVKGYQGDDKEELLLVPFYQATAHNNHFFLRDPGMSILTMASSKTTRKEPWRD